MHNRGFTLIEILVAVAIIGMLSSVIFAALGTARMKGRDAQRVSALQQVARALELYYSNNNAYPCGDNQYFDFDCGSVGGGNGFADLSAVLSPTYIPSMSQTLGDRCVWYQNRRNGQGYVLVFQPEQSALLAKDHDCYLPATWYCIGNNF